MGCAASRVAVVSADGDAIARSLRAALSTKQETLALRSAGGPLANHADDAWSEQLRQDICDVEKLLARREKALELGTLAPSESDAEVAAAAFAARLAATAEEDLRQKWSSTPRIEGTTRPTAARRAAVSVRTPPATSPSVRSPGGTKHSWNLGADDGPGELFSPGREPAETPVARRQ